MFVFFLNSRPTKKIPMSCWFHICEECIGAQSLKTDEIVFAVLLLILLI